MTPTPKPAPLVLRAGCRYVRRDGQITAPLQMTPAQCENSYTYPFYDRGYTYRESGRYNVDFESPLDLIRLYRKSTPRPRRAKVVRWCWMAGDMVFSRASRAEASGCRDYHRKTIGYACSPIEKHTFASPKPKDRK